MRLALAMLFLFALSAHAADTKTTIAFNVDNHYDVELIATPADLCSVSIATLRPMSFVYTECYDGNGNSPPIGAAIVCMGHEDATFTQPAMPTDVRVVALICAGHTIANPVHGRNSPPTLNNDSSAVCYAELWSSATQTATVWIST